MKRLFVFILLLLAGYSQAKAQFTKRECSSKMRKLAGKKVDSMVLEQRREALRLTATTPYIMKLFVVIFANSDGSNLAASQADVRRQITNMSNFYAPRNICFILSAFQQVNSSDLNNHDADNEEDDLEPYVRDNHITVFVHNTLFGDDGGLNGNAYGIPNNYLSIVGSAIASTDNLSTLAHEMGHCFGLYHTFEDANGVENRARSGDCRNCEDNGDYICDTQADRDVDDAFIRASDCTYTGSRRDDCDALLLMEPTNIMTYGRRSCRDRFTSAQGSRARDHIVSESILTDAIAVDNLTVAIPATYTSGFALFIARNTVTFNSPALQSTQTTRLSASAKAIVIKPGTHFKPTNELGYAVLRVNPFCD